MTLEWSKSSATSLGRIAQAVAEIHLHSQGHANCSELTQMDLLFAIDILVSSLWLTLFGGGTVS